MEKDKISETIHVFATTAGVTCESFDDDKTLKAFMANLERQGWAFMPELKNEVDKKDKRIKELKDKIEVACECAGCMSTDPKCKDCIIVKAMKQKSD